MSYATGAVKMYTADVDMYIRRGCGHVECDLNLVETVMAQSWRPPLPSLEGGGIDGRKEATVIYPTSSMSALSHDFRTTSPPLSQPPSAPHTQHPREKWNCLQPTGKKHL
jgi:hypothetical protein